MKTKRNKKPDHPYASYKKGEKPKKEKRERPGQKETSWSILTETDGTFTNRQDIFTKINDEELIIGKRKTLFNYLNFFFTICSMVGMIGFFIYVIYGVENNFSFVDFLFSVFCIIIMGVLALPEIIKSWEKLNNYILILNRLKGTATVHKYSFRHKTTSVYSFEKIDIEVGTLNKRKRGSLYICGKYPWFFIHLFTISKDREAPYISFFVWYMDKNRPLPPHSFFDPYREKDYKRRKAEGFPPPLYPSEIPIPEYKEE